MAGRVQIGAFSFACTASFLPSLNLVTLLSAFRSSSVAEACVPVTRYVGFLELHSLNALL